SRHFKNEDNAKFKGHLLGIVNLWEIAIREVQARLDGPLHVGLTLVSDRVVGGDAAGVQRVLKVASVGVVGTAGLVAAIAAVVHQVADIVLRNAESFLGAEELTGTGAAFRLGVKWRGHGA